MAYRGRQWFGNLTRNQRYRRRLAASDYDQDLALYYNFVTHPSLQAMEDVALGTRVGPTLNLTRTTDRSIKDYEGFIRRVIIGEPAFTGSRYVLNVCDHSETMDTWTIQTGCTVVGTVAGPGGDGPDTAIEIDWAAAAANKGVYQAGLINQLVVGQTVFNRSLWIKASTTGPFTLTDPNGSAESQNFELTTEWQRVDAFFANQNASAGLWIQKENGSPDTIFVTGMQMEDVSGQADQSASEYQANTDAFVLTGTTYATQKDGTTALTTPISGISIWEERTNIIFPSGDLNTYTNGGLDAIVDTTHVAPDGTFMTFVNVNPNNAQHRIYLPETTTTATNYAVSCHVKDGGVKYVGMTFYGNVNNFVTMVADLTAGTVTKTGVGATSGTLVGSGIEALDNGIFRIWVAGSIVPTTGFLMIWAASSATPTFDTAGQEVWLGVEGEDFYAWGTGFEKGDHPGPYIPTTLSSVTRNGDDYQTPLTGDDIINYDTTFYHTIKYDYSAIQTADYNISRTGGLAGYQLYAVSAATLRFTVWDPGLVGYINLQSGSLPNVLYRKAVAVSSNNFEGWSNGVDVGVGGDQIFPPQLDIDVLRLGTRENNNAYIKGDMGEFRRYRGAKDAFFVKALSNGTQEA